MTFLGKKQPKPKLISLQCFHCGQYFTISAEHVRTPAYCNECKD